MWSLSRAAPVALMAVFVGAAGPVLAQDELLGDAAAGERVFRACMACHAVGEGAQNKIGPHLNDVFGRVPGSLEDFQYSPAMVAYGEAHVWDAQTLSDYLAAPRQVVEGTKMAYAGVRKDDQRADLLAYLAQFDAQGAEVSN